MIESKKGFILIQDNDAHWYVVPEEMKSEWFNFIELDPDDEVSLDVPEWAEAVGGSPSLITFYNYRVN